jgi:hypothetical protein
MPGQRAESNELSSAASALLSGLFFSFKPFFHYFDVSGVEVVCIYISVLGYVIHGTGTVVTHASQDFSLI